MMNPAGRLVISSVLLLATLLTVQLRSTGAAINLSKPLEAFPKRIGDWRGQADTVLEPDILDILKVSDYLMRRYADPEGRSVWLYVGYWATQRKGAQIHSPKNCLPGSGWEPVEASRIAIAVPGEGPITVNRYLVQKERDVQVVLYWYHSQGEVIPGELAAKIAMVRNSVLRNRTDGALIRVSGLVQGGVQETNDRLIRFVQILYPSLSQTLPN